MNLTDGAHEPAGASPSPDPGARTPAPESAQAGSGDTGTATPASQSAQAGSGDTGTATPTPESTESFTEIGPSDPGVIVQKRELIIEAKTERGLVMSVRQYTRIQERIRKEIGGHSTSIWLALGLAFLGVGATIVVTLVSTSSSNINAATKGELEVAAWACFVIAGIFGVVHYIRDQEKRKTANDICSEMDASSGRSLEV